MIDVFIHGFLIGISLIVAIGSQNAYILKLGLLKQHIFKAVMFCIISDVLLISVGVLGLGFFIKDNQILINAITIFGIVFLSAYAFLSFKSAFKNESLKIDNEVKTNPVKKIFAMLFMFTFLNPHVYLDTVLLIGGIGANIENDLKIFFILGTSAASAVWFLSLGYFSRLLIPIFKKPITWKILDILIGILMLYIAYSLVDLVKF
ncbi:amino acid transporter [Malaciobacter molluscorum LMG 25693]|uniref:Amino acid transporter n=1 Tax=Malaciobacter molluscorum LMG 25693 TaxID=870501 RepID=A0A2G1DHJ1_9BACT|nr:LysE/ArgO family amino acid transporter [Malaciobacter molluscorum]AXX93323.1 transporter, LysE family [Malaciobacter molluscorum LMG 25693]PHO17979.1 amino acid transporter [Malaciobacter molluscorum LMG 25693]